MTVAISAITRSMGGRPTFYRGRTSHDFNSNPHAGAAFRHAASCGTGLSLVARGVGLLSHRSHTTPMIAPAMNKITKAVATRRRRRSRSICKFAKCRRGSMGKIVPTKQDTTR
jgi:hypothetical protein